MADVITLQEALALGNNGNTSSTPTSTTSQKSTAPTADVTQNTSNSSRNVITLQEALALGNGGTTPTTQTSSETNSKKSASEYYAGTNYSASPSKQYANAAYGAVTEALSKPSNAYLANLVKENPNYVANTLYQQWLSSNATADTATKNATRSAYFSAAQQYQSEHSTAPSASQSTVAYDSNGNVDATGTLLNVINDAKAINNAANAAKPTGNTKGSEDYDAAVLNVYKHLGGKTLLGKVLNENLYQQATEIVNDSGFWKDNTKQVTLPNRFNNIIANSIMARAEAKAGNATSNLYGSRTGKNYLDYYNDYADKGYASKLLSNVGNTVFNYANNVVNFELTGLNAVTGGKIQNSSVFNIANFLQNATSGVSGLKSSALRDNTSFIGRLILDLEQTTIEQGLDRAFAVITGIPGGSLGIMGVRVFGAGAQEAEDAGKGIDQQVLSGVVQAGIEVATELAGGVGGSWRGRGYIDSVFDVLDDFVSTKTGSELVGTLARAFGSEAVEEMTSDVLNPIVSWALGMSDDVTDFKSLLAAIWGNGNLLYDGLLGGLAGMFGGAQVSLQQSRASRQIGIDVAIYKAAQSIVEDKKLRAKFEIKTGIELSSDNEAATAQVAAAIANDIVDGETTAREVRDAITSYGAIGSSEGYNNIFSNILANMGGAETVGADTFTKQGQKPKQKPKQKQTLTSERERSEYAKGTYGNSESDLSAELALSEYARSVKNDDGLTWEEYLLDSRADINADVLYKRWKLGVTEPTIAEAKKGKAYSLEVQAGETDVEIAKVQNTRHERFDVLPDETQAQIKEIVRLANDYISSAQNVKKHYQGAEGSFVNLKSLEEDKNKLREAVKNYSSQAYDEAFHLEPNGEFAIDRAISEGKVKSGREFADWARLVYKTSIDVTKATKIQEEQESKLAKLHEQREGLLKEIAERDTKSKVQAEAEKKAKAKKETMAQEKPKKSGVDLLVEEATKKPIEAKKSEDGKTTPPKQQEAKKAASEELNKQESENKPKTGADHLAEAASKPAQEKEKTEPVETKPDSLSKFTKESFKALLARNGFSEQQRNDIAPTLFRILNGEKITLSEVEKMLDDDGALSPKFKTILEKYLGVDFSPYTFFEGAEYVNRNEALEALNDKAAENDAKAQGKEYKPRTREEVQEAHDAEMEPLKEAGAWEPWEPSEREKKIIDAWSGRTKKAKPLGAPEKGTKWPEKYTRIRRRLYGMAFRASIDANTGDAEIDAQLETLNKEIDYLSAKVADEKTAEAAARSLERTIKSARNAATEQNTEDAETKAKVAEEKKAARTAKQISELEAHAAEIESSLSEHKEQLENAKEAFEEAEREYNEAYEKWFNSSYTNIEGKGYVRRNAKFTHNYEFYHLDELKDARDAREYDCSKLERQIKEETRQLAYVNERLNGLKNPTTQKSKSTSTEPKAEAKSEHAAATEVETDVDYKSELSKLEKQRKDIIAKVADKLYSNYAKRAAEKLFEYSNKKIGCKLQ